MQSSVSLNTGYMGKRRVKPGENGPGLPDPCLGKERDFS